MVFNYTKNTKVNIDGKDHLIMMGNGMTGIGSRTYWINDKKQDRQCVMQSLNIEEGLHSIYTIKWRDTPWDKIDVIIHNDFIPQLLSEENSWREPIKREIK